MVDEGDPGRQRGWGAGASECPVGDDLGVPELAYGPMFHHAAFDAGELARRRRGISVSVCVPARDEQDTVGDVVRTVVGELTSAGGGADLVDEVVVVDDGSHDDTAAVSALAGARVVRSESAGGGKGAAMALGLASTSGDLVAFLDADVRDFGAHFVTGLLGPLLTDADVQMTKAFYERPLHGEPAGGGRVTELMARPVIDQLFPELGGIRQPLAGEQALRRSALARITLEPGYGVELGLLVDVAERFGVSSIAQVDLGTRVHRNRPIEQLRLHASDVLAAGLARAGATLSGERFSPGC
ncbi:MAG: glucosyl-3-phosphoglycerate synthase [Acidimicrobiales bacterium]